MPVSWAMCVSAGPVMLAQLSSPRLVSAAAGQPSPPRRHGTCTLRHRAKKLHADPLG